MSESTYPYPDEPIRTHWDGCYRVQGHHNCAVARVDRLEKELADAKMEIIHLQESMDAIFQESMDAMDTP